MKSLSVAALLAFALSPQPGCRKTAVAGGNREVDTGKMIQQLKDPQMAKRYEAAATLGQGGAASAAAVPALTDALRDADYSVRGAAAQALGQIGEKAGSAAPVLIEMLKKDPQAAGSAARALADLGPAGRPALPALMDALSNSDVTESVAAALERMGEGKAAAQRLMNVVKDQRADPKARAAAVMGLKHAGDHEAAVALMIAFIEDKAAVPEVRRAASLAVGHMGYGGVEGAKRAVPALLANLGQPDVGNHAWSLWALGATEQTVARLTELLAHRDPNVRVSAARGLASMAGGNAPPEAKAAVPALIQALKTKGAVRTVAMYTLGEIGPGAQEAVPALMELLKDDDSWTRDRANEAIKKIAPNQ